MRSFISSRRPVIREDRLSFHRDLTYSDFSPIASDERATQVEQYYLLTATIKWKRDLNVLKIESSLTLRYLTYCGIKQQQKKQDSTSSNLAHEQTFMLFDYIYSVSREIFLEMFQFRRFRR